MDLPHSFGRCLVRTPHRMLREGHKSSTFLHSLDKIAIPRILIVLCLDSFHEINHSKESLDGVNKAAASVSTNQPVRLIFITPWPM